MAGTSRTITVRVAALAAGLLLVLAWRDGAPAPRDAAQAQSGSPLWIVPATGSDDGESAIARAVARLTGEDPDPEAALELLTPLVDDPALGGYALLYKGRAELALDRHASALESAFALIGRDPRGQLGEDAGWLAVDAAETAQDDETALRVLQAMVADPHLSRPAEAWLRLGRAALERGQRERAIEAFERARYEHALTREAGQASDALEDLIGRSRLASRDRYDRELARAHQLFAVGRYADAQDGYQLIADLATGDDRDLIALRLAICDYHRGRLTTAQQAINAYVHDSDDPARVPEARFYYLSAQRDRRQFADYIQRVAEFVEMYPASPFAARALDELGTHYILADEDAKAAATFLELYQRYPESPEAARAAWKSGWWDYRHGEYRRAIQTFESAFDTFSSSNYRPSWIYWAARAHRQLGDREAADTGFERVISYYRNSYYGREAARALQSLRAAGLPAPGLPVAPASLELPASIVAGDPPPNAERIRLLLAAGLYDDALGELRRAQREGGSTPVIEATMSWAYARRGDLRLSINAMRRAYPEFMAAGGEALPEDILRAIFPVAHWDLISSRAAQHDLDPFLMTALVAQESTFQPAVRSAANAYGLMQIIPGTGRRLARQLDISPFRTSLLVDPEINVRMGMRYFADLLDEFGHPAYALASYNAGEHRIRVWRRERPGMDLDEWIDDIPFPETQNYVKRILGTAEDYRQLYGHLSPAHAVRPSGLLEGPASAGPDLRR